MFVDATSTAVKLYLPIDWADDYERDTEAFIGLALIGLAFLGFAFMRLCACLCFRRPKLLFERFVSAAP